MVNYYTSMKSAINKHRKGVLITCSLLLFAIFGLITESVIQGHTKELDRAVSMAFHSIQNPLLDAIMKLVTWAGSAIPIVLAILLMAYWALRRGDRRAAMILAGVAIVNQNANITLKLLIARPRPTLFSGIELPSSYAFPSGHAMAAAAVVGTIGVLMVRFRPSLTVPVAISTPLLILLIGLSRIYLGVHWPTDVLAGFVAGTGILLIGLATLGRCSRPTRP